MSTLSDNRCILNFGAVDSCVTAPFWPERGAVRGVSCTRQAWKVRFCANLGGATAESGHGSVDMGRSTARMRLKSGREQSCAICLRFAYGADGPVAAYVKRCRETMTKPRPAPGRCAGGSTCVRQSVSGRRK